MTELQKLQKLLAYQYQLMQACNKFDLVTFYHDIHNLIAVDSFSEMKENLKLIHITKQDSEVLTEGKYYNFDFNYVQKMYNTIIGLNK